MTTASKYISALLISCTVTLIAPRMMCAEQIEYQSLREAAHVKSIASDDFFNVLALKPGMTILDIGTGTGQFAFEFAKRLKGNGRVFATDIDAKCINYVRQEANKRRLTNIFPVLVKKEGLDDFYSKQKYDLITFFHLPVLTADYFKRLRPFLSDDGHLIIMVYKNALSFSLKDFNDIRGFVTKLSQEPADSPFYNGLSDSTRRLIDQNSGAEPSEHLLDAIVSDFNQMLLDAHFASNFVDGSVFKKGINFSPEEAIFADFLLMLMLEEKVFEKELVTLSSKEKRVAKRLNKLLFIQRFRQYFYKEGMFTFENGQRIIVNVQSAGFTLKKLYADLLPFEEIVVFAK